MANFSDCPEHYGLVTRTLHWGMAFLFAAQFLAAAAHWALPRENGLREVLWSYHPTLGITLFLLVLARGVWGLLNIRQRPPHLGRIGQAAILGHVLIYVLMIVVPATRILAAAGSERGLTYLGMVVFSPREAKVAWMQALAEWHGEMGWFLALIVLGHIGMAIIWHHLIQRDGILKRMKG